MSTPQASPADTPWFTQDADAAVRALDSDREHGLTSAAAAERLARYGANTIAAEPQPSAWKIALRQVADPMNLMLVAVSVLGVFIDQPGLTVLLGALVRAFELEYIDWNAALTASVPPKVLDMNIKAFEAGYQFQG